MGWQRTGADRNPVNRKYALPLAWLAEKGDLDMRIDMKKLRGKLNDKARELEIANYQRKQRHLIRMGQADGLWERTKAFIGYQEPPIEEGSESSTDK